MVEMVRNSYGSRPTLALKAAVHDMENLPEELEKFDNYYYLRDRMFARLREDRKSINTTAVSSLTKEHKHLKPRVGNKYSFGFAPQKIKNR